MSISLESLTQQLQETAKVIALVPEFKKMDHEPKQQQTSRPENKNISHKWTGKGV